MGDNLEKISAQMRKGILEYVILMIIDSGDVYSSDILKMLKENNLIVVEGTLYPLLSRLRKESIITYFWVESSSGPPRKYFKLTKEGKELLKTMNIVWTDLRDAVKNIGKK
ncbi:PadR family transcriptional regulator [Candidatus Gracilibacteria bacterium 28_42_T64]|nr:PadR family transcriptional regulator [Candidatus Gracilibacteria bacterium 28_42_T64]